ncbi:MAG: nucleotidyltransferase domain-containing protein, partial [Patescibacteria group bacterium]
EIPLNVYFLLMDLISDIKLIKTEVYLFGSYSKLIYREDSDIDIAILNNNSFKKELINKFIKKLEKKYNKKIELHFFNKSEFYKNKKDPLIKDIIRNGIKLL